MGICGSKSTAAVANNPFELDVLKGHTGGINSMATSEDGTIVATASDDKTVRLWTTHTERAECFGVLQGHEGYVNCVLIDDLYVVSGSADATVRKWDMQTCECVLVMTGHVQPINRIICTGDFLFSSSYDRTARCWDFETGQCLRTFTGHKRGVYPMIFVPAAVDDNAEADVLVTGSADFTAIVWSFETAQPVHTLAEHTGTVTCMATDVTGQILLTGSTDFTVRSWRLSNGERLRVFEGHHSSVICMTVKKTHTRRRWCYFS
jgi:WD repeat-containing protein 86